MNRSSSESESEPSAIDRAIADYLQTRDAQPDIDREEFLARYPELRAELAEFIDNELNALYFAQTPSPSPVVDLEQTVEYRSSQSDTAQEAYKSGTRAVPDLGPYRLTTFSRRRRHGPSV